MKVRIARKVWKYLERYSHGKAMHALRRLRVLDERMRRKLSPPTEDAGS